MSLYSHKQNGTGAVQPWSQAVTLAEAGKGCDGLFGLYDSLGDKTLVGANTIATLQDGPEKVVRYGALTLGDGVTVTSLTAANRCKGLTILCDSLTVKANATLHMTGKGARVLTSDDPFFPFVDFRIPFKIVMDSCRMSLAQAFAVIREQGLAPWDGGTFQHLVAAMFGFNLGISAPGGTTLMLLGGCGAGKDGVYISASQAVAGAVGSAGSTGGMGGGGQGGVYVSGGDHYGSKSGSGCPYSGGSGTGGHYQTGGTNATSPPLSSPYSGPGGKGGAGMWSAMTMCMSDALRLPGWGGGGAGNPGGVSAAATTTELVGGCGCGGKLTIICRGAITVQSGGKIEANGMPGAGDGSSAGGGGAGGGHVSLISPVSPSNSGTIQAAGGAGGAGYVGAAGGAGGAGSVVTKTFSDMGW